MINFDINKWNADLYDKNITKTDDVDFIIDLIGLSSVRVLEIGCGSGRIAIPLINAGHIVHGIDIDEYMLNKIPNKATDLSSLTYEHANALNANWINEFDVVLLADNLLYNISSEKLDYCIAQQQLIKNSANALVKGGHILIDYGYISNPTLYYNFVGKRIVWSGTDSEGNSGSMLLMDSKFDIDTNINTFIRHFEIVLKNGERLTMDIQCEKHLAKPAQIKSWLTNSGFKIEQEYGDYFKMPINKFSKRVILYAKKL